MEQMPVAVRVLPMTSKIEQEFDGCRTIQDIQTKFFLSALPIRPGCSYLYRRRGLDANSGTIVLFQCQGQIIASAKFLGSERFDQPDADGYTGQLHFDPMTIRTFKPINADGIRAFWPTFKRFGQSSLHLPPEGYPAFLNQLEDVRQPSHQSPASPTDDPSTSEPSETSGQWTDAEYKATVEAYLWMLEQEQNGKPYNKSKVNQDLRDGPLLARGKPSVEFRMRNISAVLEELCLPRIKGYVPAGNIRGVGKEKIKFYLANAGTYKPENYEPTDDPDTLEQRVRDLKDKIESSIDPAGNKTPQQTTATITRYVRDPAVKASVLKKAGGVCEGCGTNAPFTNTDGDPFLEVHHLKELGVKGSDTVTNAVALCPNCHRRCHHSSDKIAFTDNIYLKVARLVPE